MYNTSNWTRSILVTVPQSVVVAGTLSGDFSTLLYTEVSLATNGTNDLFYEHYQIILLDLRFPKDSIRYVICASQSYLRPYVCWPPNYADCLRIIP